jgi:hypothetical protein
MSSVSFDHQWLALLEELGGWIKHTFCLGFPSISPDVHFQAKACEVLEDKIHALGEAVLCIEGESTVVYVKALKYFICAEECGAEHFRSVAAELAMLNQIITSSHNSDNFNVFMFLFHFESLSKRSHKKEK